MGTMTYLFLKIGMIKWCDNMFWYAFNKFVQMLSVVDSSVFAANMLVIYNINKYLMNQ